MAEHMDHAWALAASVHVPVRLDAKENCWEDMAYEMGRGGRQERVGAGDTQSHFGDGVEGGERLLEALEAQEAQRCARLVAVGAGLVAETVDHLERPKVSTQTEVVVQRMAVQESGGVIVVVQEEQTSIVLGLRPRRYTVLSSSDTFGTDTM